MTVFVKLADALEINIDRFLWKTKGGIVGKIQDTGFRLKPAVPPTNKDISTMQIQTAKEKITKVVLSQPEDATYDEIMRELAFAKMVDRGLEDVRAGRVISNGEMAGRIRAWKK